MLWASGEIDGAIDLCLEGVGGNPGSALSRRTRARLHSRQSRRDAHRAGQSSTAATSSPKPVPLLLDPWQLWVIFDHVALLRAREGQHELAARAAGFTNASYQAHGATRQVNEQRAHDTLLTILRHEIGCERLGQLIEEGSFFTEEVAATIAMADSAT